MVCRIRSKLDPVFGANRRQRRRRRSWGLELTRNVVRIIDELRGRLVDEEARVVQAVREELAALAALA